MQNIKYEELGGKKFKGERKRMKITSKSGEKALKVYVFAV